jgi:molybdopterin converting factor small subunit
VGGTGSGTGSVDVTVRYFAGAKAAAGVSQESVSVPGPGSGPGSGSGSGSVGPTVAGLVDVLVQRHGGKLAQVLTACTFLVDEVAGGPERVLRDGVQVDVLPPFAGG